MRVCLRDQMEVRPVVSVPCQHRRPPLFAASLCPVQSPLSGFLGQEVCTHGDTLHRTALWSRSSLREDGARTLCHCLRLFSLLTFTLPPLSPADCNLLLTTARSPLDDWTRAFMCECVPLCRGPSYREHVGVSLHYYTLL